jgi:hypothetical protein
MAVAALSAVLFSGCATPTRYEDNLIETQIQPTNPRRLVLTFERESNFTALAHRRVTVTVKAPATLISPASGSGLTDSSGKIEIVVEPVAIYDRKALKSGDIVVDYPAQLTVAIAADSKVYEWDLDGHDSFARYGDPLYRGLDRDPDTSDLYLTLTVP